MKQTKPNIPPSPNKSTPGNSKPGKLPAGTAEAKNPLASSPAKKRSGSVLTWPMILLMVIAVLVLGAVLFFSATQEHFTPNELEQDNSMGTAIAATGFTPPPTFEPGSDFGINLVILGLRDYTPAFPNEKINFYIFNTRQKSVFVSNCDGIVLERFIGTDPKDKTQLKDDKNWQAIAPGGYRFCGPATGREAKQIEPGIKADATFAFDRKLTKPFNGESWDVPGTYRLLVTYYLLCPPSSLRASDCSDEHSYPSDEFKIVAPPAGYTPPPTARATPTDLTPKS